VALDGGKMRGRRSLLNYNVQLKKISKIFCILFASSRINKEGEKKKKDRKTERFTKEKKRLRKITCVKLISHCQVIQFCLIILIELLSRK
jgi:hypothetical protein